MSVFTQDDASTYGIDWDGPVTEVQPDFVEVPETNCPLADAQIEEVMNQVPEDVTIMNAVDVYLHVVSQITTIMSA